MLQAMSSALTAINAFRTQQDVTANNVANVNSEGFKASRVEMKASEAGGVQAQVQPTDAPAAQVVEQRGGEDYVLELSNVNLAEEMTNMISAERGLEANAQTIRTQDEMLGTLLDMLG